MLIDVPLRIRYRTTVRSAHVAALGALAFVVWLRCNSSDGGGGFLFLIELKLLRGRQILK